VGRVENVAAQNCTTEQVAGGWDDMAVSSSCSSSNRGGIHSSSFLCWYRCPHDSIAIAIAIAITISIALIVIVVRGIEIGSWSLMKQIAVEERKIIRG